MFWRKDEFEVYQPKLLSQKLPKFKFRRCAHIQRNQRRTLGRTPRECSVCKGRDFVRMNE